MKFPTFGHWQSKHTFMSCAASPRWVCRALFYSVIFFLLITTAQTHAQETQLEILSLQYRLVDDVLPVLRPLVDQSGSLSGMNNQLIIRTTPENLAELKRVLAEIDRPLRSLRIHVRFADREAFSSRGHSGSVSYRKLPIEIHADDESWRGVREWRDSDQANRPSQTATAPSRHLPESRTGQITYRHWNTQNEAAGDSTYFVRTLEGRSAWIRTGEHVPFVSRSVVLYPYGHDVIDTIDYLDISAGFYVQPHLQNERVTLFISPQQDRLKRHSADHIQRRGAEMQVTGVIGEWIDLGGISNQEQDEQRGLLTKRRHSGEEEWHMWVLVEEVE